jgi:hypothetical protein
MKTSTKPLYKSKTIVSKLMITLLIGSALGSVAPAFADPRWDRDHGRYDHRDYHHDHRWDHRDRVYVQPTPVYVPPPVYYAPPERSSGINIVLPLHIR